MALIFYLSSLSRLPVPLPVASIDKLYHLLEYAALGFLVTRAFLNSSPQIFRDSPWISAFLFATLYAASNEWHQSFVQGRSASVWDWIADCLGNLSGVLGVYIRHRLSKPRAKIRAHR